MERFCFFVVNIGIEGMMFPYSFNRLVTLTTKAISHYCLPQFELLLVKRTIKFSHFMEK